MGKEGPFGGQAISLRAVGAIENSFNGAERSAGVGCECRGPCAVKGGKQVAKALFPLLLRVCSARRGSAPSLTVPVHGSNFRIPSCALMCVGGWEQRLKVWTWGSTCHFREASLFLPVCTTLLWFTGPALHGGVIEASGVVRPEFGSCPSTQGLQSSKRSGAWAPGPRARTPGLVSTGSSGSGRSGPGPNFVTSVSDPCNALLWMFLRFLWEHADWRRGLLVVVSWGPAPKGGADHAAGGPASPPPPRPARRLFVSNIRVSPLARLRGRGSGAILDLVQLPSPHPSPVHGPSGLGPCARGPGPAPLRYA